jgi:hypothetical protein
MYDLFQNYVTDLNKFRDAFHNELTATAEELSKAMAFYASRSDAALASFMEKATARGEELEAAAAARLNQFRGLSAIADLSGADNGRVARTPTNPDKLRISTAAERPVADVLQFESEGDRKPPPARSIALVKSAQVQSEPAA